MDSLTKFGFNEYKQFSGGDLHFIFWEFYVLQEFIFAERFANSRVTYIIRQVTPHTDSKIHESRLPFYRIQSLITHHV